MSFPDWVRKQRLARKMTMRECAERANITEPAWYNYEKSNKGDRRRKTTVAKIALGLEMDISEVTAAASHLPIADDAMIRFGIDKPATVIGAGGTPVLNTEVLQALEFRLSELSLAVRQLREFAERMNVPSLPDTMLGED